MNNSSDDISDRLRSATGDESAPTLAPELVTTASARRAPRLVNHGRATRAASASLVAVAAVAVGSLVIANPFAARAPLFLAAEGGGSSSLAEASGASMDARIGVWIDYRYEAAPGLSTDGGRGNVYQLQRRGDAESVLRDVGTALGLTGDVTESSYFDSAYPSYVIGAEDGSAPTISVTWMGTGNWWFNDPTAYPPVVCELVRYETESGTGDYEEYEECTQPEIAAADNRAPATADAQGLAAGIFAASGLEVEPADITVTADAWQTMASATLVVDGVPTAIDFAVAWAPTGDIAWAYGHSVDVIDRGEYETVSPTAAVDRLTDWRWFGSAGPEYGGGMSFLAAESGVARHITSAPGGSEIVEPAPGEPLHFEPLPVEPNGGIGDGAGGPDSGPGTDPTVDPKFDPTVDPTFEPEPIPVLVPEPEIVTVSVDSAESTLLSLWDVDGNAWLVPGYAMPHPDGWWNAVVSLVEGIIALPEPIDLEIMPFTEE